MALTRLINENGNDIVDAINTGVSKEAIRQTMSDVLNKSNDISTTPKQIQEVVEIIADMKQEKNVKENESYSSNFVRNNSEKITSALNNGLSPNEIAIALTNQVQKDDLNSKEKLRFTVRLISKLKRKEYKLSNSNQIKNGYQKIFK